MSKYLKGDGTEFNPYIIYNEESWEEFISMGVYGVNAGFASEKFFKVVSDIDCGGKLYDSGGSHATWKASLDLGGYEIKNFILHGTGFVAIAEIAGGYIKRGSLDFSLEKGSNTFFDINKARFENTRIILRKGALCGHGDSISPSELHGCLFIRSDGESIFLYEIEPAKTNKTLYFISNKNTGVGENNILSLGDESLNPLNYENLDKEYWIADGVSWPSTIKNPRPELVSGYAIKGITRVGNVRKERNITVFSAAYRLKIWDGKSNDEGEFFARLFDYYDPVIALVFDDYGYPATTDKHYNVGDIVHPSIPNGYRYICEKSGNSGKTIPDEPWSVDVIQSIGEAIFRAHPVYESKCVGPFHPEKVNLITGEKV